MPLQSTEAIVIAGHDLAEADRIIVFYTRGQGKVRAVAEGARRLRSRFGGSLQLFSHGHLVYFERPNKTLHKVNEFAVTRVHQVLREDLDRIALASALAESVALGVEEAEAFPDLFDLLAEGLDALEASARPALILHGFTLHLLRLLGYRPEWGECLHCRQPAERLTRVLLSPIQGGLVCEACQDGVVDGLPVSAEVLGFLRGAGGARLRLLDRVTLPPAAVEEAGRILQAFLRQVLGRPLRAAEFLSRL
ncbi:MAG TPA: DNA repair protein RecO [Candidatus Sulfotelmatobacter sp.]|nr:DNA repair protein RecO [Candidatus Sulfotelmatobacter sp.]